MCLRSHRGGHSGPLAHRWARAHALLVPQEERTGRLDAQHAPLSPREDTESADAAS